MVRDDVDDQLHAALVSFRDKLFQIGLRAVVGINRVVVAHGIRTADGSLLLLLADRMNRH